MARASRVAAAQLRALDRLSAVPRIKRFYLAGGTAIAFHLEHRTSRDLDIFGPEKASFVPFQAMARSEPEMAQVVRIGDATLQIVVEGVPVDVVRYPYPLLEPAVPGPRGFPTAGLLDLATNKLAAISRRGLRRDFWDLYAIAKNGISLADATSAYVRRFGVAESDLYHVTTGLTWFGEVEDVLPSGMTPQLWKRIREFFESEVPLLVRGLGASGKRRK
jgi:hypothetical protein